MDPLSVQYIYIFFNVRVKMIIHYDPATSASMTNNKFIHNWKRKQKGWGLGEATYNLSCKQVTVTFICKQQQIILSNMIITCVNILMLVEVVLWIFIFWPNLSLVDH